MIQQFQFEIPSGQQVDLDNSDLTHGIIKFKPIKKALPTSWGELGPIHGAFVGNNSAIIECVEVLATPRTKNIWPTKELATASLALCQLVRLRDVYNDGWKPDWRTIDNKYVISFAANRVDMQTYSSISHVLAFKTLEIRTLFLDTFGDLIQQAKPLL